MRLSSAQNGWTQPVMIFTTNIKCVNIHQREIEIVVNANINFHLAFTRNPQPTRNFIPAFFE